MLSWGYIWRNERKVESHLFSFLTAKNFICRKDAMFLINISGYRAAKAGLRIFQNYIENINK